MRSGKVQSLCAGQYFLNHRISPISAIVPKKPDQTDLLLKWQLHELRLPYSYSAIIPCVIGIAVGAFFFWPLSFACLFNAVQETFDFVPHQCTVRETRVTSRQFGNELGFRGEAFLEYEWSGQKFECWTLNRDTFQGNGYYKTNSAGKGRVTAEQARQKAYADIEKVQCGSNMPCWVNAKNPRQAILRKSMYFSKTAFVFSAGILLVLAGSMPFYDMYRCWSRRRIVLKPFQNDPERWNCGETLAYRIEPVFPRSGVNSLIRRFWRIAIILLVGGITVFSFEVMPILLWGAIPLLLFVIKKQFDVLIASQIPTPTVEIDKQPLIPGDSYRIHLIQFISHSLKTMTVHLLCENITIRGRGKRRETKTAELVRDEIGTADFSSETDTGLVAGQPHALSLNFKLIDNALPTSFTHPSMNAIDEIRWRIEITHLSRAGVKLKHIFPLTVIERDHTVHAQEEK